MPRQSRSRPSAPRTTSAPAQQSRGAASAAAPASGNPSAAAPHPPAAASASQPGLLATAASNIGAVAAGSVIGHGISSMLFGGGSAPAPTPEQQAPVAQQTQPAGVSCEVQAKQFTQCLDKADLPSCTWYLEQLKACQAAAAPY